MSVPCFLIGIDGVLADNSHRLHHIQCDPPDWEAYNAPELVLRDAPIQPMIDLVAHVRQGSIVMALTGRRRALYHTTWDWCYQHHVAVSYLIMRPDDDFAPAPEIKVRAVHDLWARGWRPWLMIDDDVEVLRAVTDTELGIPTSTPEDSAAVVDAIMAVDDGQGGLNDHPN